MMRNRLPGIVAITMVLATPYVVEGQTQTPPDPVRERIDLGISAHRGRDPVQARHFLEQAIELDSTSYEAQWRLAEVLMDIGKQTPDSVKSPARDSLYELSEAHARIAATLQPDSVDGHYTLAAAIGRASLTKSKKERVKRAREIREEALRALGIDSTHDKAQHVLGRWNAEIMRLSGFERFFAKTFLGGNVFNAASWDSAVVYMDRAVALAPSTIYHRLTLAEILVDLKRYSQAREQLHRVGELPIYDAMDPQYRTDAAALLGRIEGKKDKGS